MQLNRGIVLIALGHKYLKLAMQCISSIVSVGNDENYLIITDLDILPDLLVTGSSSLSILTINPISTDLAVATAYLKTQLYDLSPFDTTLYLDCDVRAVQNISCVWSYCTDTFAIARAFYPLAENETYLEPEKIETVRCLSTLGDFTQYNTGMFLFPKNEDTKSVFKDWENEWGEFKQHENMAFNRLVAKGFEPDYVLCVYNDFYPHRSPDSVLIHYIDWYKKYLNTNR